MTLRKLIILALPAALSAMLNNAYRVIDQYAVQWLGVDAQAAIASTTFILIGFFAFYSIISAGSISLVARAVGAQNTKEQKQLIGNAFSAAALMGIVILALSGWLAPVTVKVLGLKGSLADQAKTYLQWHALFCLPQAIMPTVDAVFFAFGRTRTVLLLQVAASLLNLILNPVCIYRLGFGIGGAAMATGLSQGIALLIGIVCLSGSVNASFSDYRINRTAVRIARIGLPMCWGTLMFAAVYGALLRWVISPLGGAVNAALGIGFSALEGFTWPVFWGFSMSIASIVGRSLGAGRIDEAKHAIRLAIGLMTLSGVAAAIIFRFGADFLCGLFTTDALVLKEAVLYAHILAFSQLLNAYEALAEGILSGAGKTQSILYWSAPFNILRVPFAWLFAIHYGYGAAAVWWVINLSTLLKALGKWHAVNSGKWQDE